MGHLVSLGNFVVCGGFDCDAISSRSPRQGLRQTPSQGPLVLHRRHLPVEPCVEESAEDLSDCLSLGNAQLRQVAARELRLCPGEARRVDRDSVRDGRTRRLNAGQKQRLAREALQHPVEDARERVLLRREARKNVALEFGEFTYEAADAPSPGQSLDHAVADRGFQGLKQRREERQPTLGSRFADVLRFGQPPVDLDDRGPDRFRRIPALHHRGQDAPVDQTEHRRPRIVLTEDDIELVQQSFPAHGVSESLIHSAPEECLSDRFH